MKRVGTLIFFLATTVTQMYGGIVILTGQDSDFHASFDPCAGCSNPAGAQGFLSTAIQAVRGGSTKPFLFVTSDIAPPAAVLNPDGSINTTYAFHTNTVTGIEKSGYSPGSDFVVATASTLQQQLTQNLVLYSGIVVASDFGGLLTQAELQILNDSKTSIDEFLISGGGLLALGESNDGIGPNATYNEPGHVLNPNLGLLGTATPYAFLPFSVLSVNSYGMHEDVPGLTSYGAGLGFTSNDFSGNYFFNTFQPANGYHVLDTDPNGKIVALAVDVVAPEPATSVLMALSFLCAAFGVHRRLTPGRGGSQDRRIVPQ